ncbi:MAG: prepilin peptidase [Solirubrobacterales bacterium]
MTAVLLDASLVVLLGAVTISDLRTRLVPDRALGAALLVGLPACAFADPGGLPERLLAAVGAGGFLLAAALVRPGGMGLGDAKLAAVLGIYLGPAVIEALAVAFAAGSIAGVVLIARRGWAARSSTIPFAPFLALGALAAIGTA